jgi:hypothetical protein
MLFWNLSKHLVLFFVFGLEKMNACDDSYQCRFGQQCCEETNTCQASCSESHKTNVGVLIGIVAAVAVGNALFWLTFCCLCWCKGSRKSRFRYRSFGENEDNRGPNHDDDIDEDMIDNNDGLVHNTVDAVHNNDLVINNEDAITDHYPDDEMSKVLGRKDKSEKEEISLSIIKIKRPILKPKRETRCKRNASV